MILSYVIRLIATDFRSEKFDNIKNNFKIKYLLQCPDSHRPLKNTSINSKSVQLLCKDKMAACEYFTSIGVCTPPTDIYNVQKASEAINQGIELIVKPRLGSRGGGVIHCCSKSDLPDSFEQECIMQPKINALTWDVRVVLHKIANHAPVRITYFYSRLADEGNFCTNINTGGRAEATEKLAQIYFENIYHSFVADVKDFSLHIAQAIAADFDTPHLQLGLDIMTDECRNLTLLEANTAPGNKGLYRLANAENSLHRGHQLVYTSQERSQWRSRLAITKRKQEYIRMQKK